MPTKIPAYLQEAFNEAESTESSIPKYLQDAFEEYEEAPAKKTTAKETAKEGVAKGAAELASLPKVMVDLFRIMQQKVPAAAGLLSKIIPPEAAQSASDALPAYEDVLQNLRQYLEVNPDEASEAGSNIIGSGIGGLPFGGAGALAGVVGQSASEAAKAAGLPEWAQTTADIGFSLATPSGRRKALAKGLEREVAKDTERAALYAFGKDAGLTDKALTPALQSEKKLATYGKLAKQSDKSRAALQESKEAIGGLYGPVVERGKAIPVDPLQKQAFAEALESIKTELAHTVKANPEKQKAIEFLEDSIKKVYQKDIDGGQLINYFQDLNEVVDWKKLGAGKKGLTQAKTAVLKALNKADPNLAAEFQNINKLYSRISKAQEKIGYPKTMEHWINMGEAGSFLYKLATFEPISAAKIAGAAGVGEGLRWLSTQMLVNPKFQGLHAKLVNAIAARKKVAAYQIYKQIKKEAEKEPEGKEIDWPSLD